MSVLAAAFFFNASVLAHESNFADLVEKTSPSIVGVGTYQATRRPPAQLIGTGFVVGDGRIIVTNHHVVPGVLDHNKRERLVVFTGKGRQPELRDATLLDFDGEHDLALLKISGAALPPITLAADTEVREGDEIAFTGFPIGAVLGLYPATHRGIVAAITPVAIPARRSEDLSAAQVLTLRNPYEVLQLDATAYPGNSGSPVYKRDTGEVVGVINQVLIKGKKENVLSAPSGITYAIPVGHVNKLLRRANAR